MNTTVQNDAMNIKKLIREAEAVSDEVMVACARLKQAMISARQNPDIGVDIGQKALMRLTQAEQQALSMSTSLLRVHDEMSKIARETMRMDDGTPTEIEPSALAADVQIARPETVE